MAVLKETEQRLRKMFMVWNLGVFLYVLYLDYGHGETAIINKDELQNGVCDGDTLNLQCNPSCSFTKLHWSKDMKTGNEIGTCYFHKNNRHCSDESKYNVSEKLTYTTNITVNYNKDLTTWSCHVTCGKVIEKDSILVKPCISGFRVSSQYNSALKTLDISVTHQDFNLSSGIELRNSASSNELTSCRWKEKTTSCTPPPAEYSVNGSTSGFIFTVHNVPPSSTYNYTLFMDGQTKAITVNSSIPPSVKQNDFVSSRISINRDKYIEFKVGIPCLIFVIVAIISIIVMCKKRRRLNEWLKHQASNHETVHLRSVLAEA